MKIGFVILNYNSWEITKKLAMKVAAFRTISKVVIVDNVSTDSSYEYLKKLNSDFIEVVFSDKNGGYSYGNNLGAKRCVDEGIDILFISNPDVDVEESDIQMIIDGFKDTDFSVLSGIEFDLGGKLVHPPLCKLMTFKDDLLDCFFIGRKAYMHKRITSLNLAKKIQQVEMVKGSFFAVRLSDFIAVGGFDEGVFLYCEERILARRMADKGKKIGVIIGLKYKHNHSGSITNSYNTVASQIKVLYKSRLFYNKKYNHIGSIGIMVLRSAMWISLGEYYLMDILKNRKSH